MDYFYSLSQGEETSKTNVIEQFFFFCWGNYSPAVFLLSLKKLFCIYLVKLTPVVVDQGAVIPPFLSELPAKIHSTEGLPVFPLHLNRKKPESPRRWPERIHRILSNCTARQVWRLCGLQPSVSSRLSLALWPVTFVYSGPQRSPESSRCQGLARQSRRNWFSLQTRSTTKINKQT